MSFLLITSTVGISISRHYCGGNLINVSVFSEAESCCGDADCCHTENSFVQVKENFVSSAITDSGSIHQFELSILELPVSFEDFSVESESYEFFVAESPPPLLTPCKLSLLQTYLI